MNEGELRGLFLSGRNGDKAAQRAFLTEAALLLRGYFRNRLRDRSADAEDLTQETLCSLHLRRHSYDEAFPLTAWMFAIARYRLYDHLRRLRRRPEAALDEVERGADDPCFAACDATRDSARLLERLPAKQRAAIRLVKLEERSVREAAAATGCSESDIKISIHRGMKSLRRLVEAVPVA